MMRALLLGIVCVLAACGAAQAPSSTAVITEAAADGPHPFPNIQASTLADLKAAACGWAQAHYLAPEKARAETPVIYREIDPKHGLNNVPPGLGFRDVYINTLAAPNANAAAPQYFEDFLATAGSYRLTLIGRRDANSRDEAFCPTTLRQVIYTDGSVGSYEGGFQSVCVNVSRAEPPENAAVLERYEDIEIPSGPYVVQWSGYRWSGGGFVAFPTFTEPSEEYEGESSLTCPDSFVEGFSHQTELDRRGWLIQLAPEPTPVPPPQPR